MCVCVCVDNGRIHVKYMFVGTLQVCRDGFDFLCDEVR